MEFGMSRRIKPNEKYVRILMKEIWRNLHCPNKNKELWNYVYNNLYKNVVPSLDFDQGTTLLICLSLQRSYPSSYL